MTNERIGSFIALLRKESGMTQEQLAERLGVTNRSISRWENGKTLPDLSMMQILCREFDISISELLSGQRQSSDADSLADLQLLFEYADRKNRETSIQLRRIFLSGFFFLLLAFFTGQLSPPVFSDARLPQTAIPYVFLCIGIVFEAAGFYQTRISTIFTQQQLAVMMQPEGRLKMRTGDEMLQFASKHQKHIQKQHRSAFAKIAETLADNEYVTFSMIADSYQIDNGPVPWHVSLAVTNRRILLCGENMRGVLLTGYRTDGYDLKDVLSAELLDRKILIKTTKHTIFFGGTELETVLPRLENALKNAS